MAGDWGGVLSGGEDLPGNVCTWHIRGKRRGAVHAGRGNLPWTMVMQLRKNRATWMAGRTSEAFMTLLQPRYCARFSVTAAKVSLLWFFGRDEHR